MSKTLRNSLRRKKKSLNNYKRKSKRLIKRLSKRIKKKYTKRKHQIKIKDRGSAKKGKKKSTNQGQRQSQSSQSQSQTNASEASTTNTSRTIPKNFLDLSIEDIKTFKDSQFKKRESFSTLLINLGFQNTYGDEALHVYELKVEGNGVFEGEPAQFGIRISKRIADKTLIVERKNDLVKAVRIKDELVKLILEEELINASESKLRSLGFSQAKSMVANRDKRLAEQQTEKVSKKSLKAHLEDIQKMIEKNSSKKTGIADQPEPESEFSQLVQLTPEQIEEKYNLDQKKLLKKHKKDMVKEEEISLRRDNIRTYIEFQFTLIASQIPPGDLETIKEEIITGIEKEFNDAVSRDVAIVKLITPERGWYKYSKICFKPFEEYLTLFYPIDGPHVKPFKQALKYFEDNVFSILMANRFIELDGLFRLYVPESITTGLVDISKKNEMLYKGLPIYTNKNKSFVYFEDDDYKVPISNLILASYPKIILSLSNPKSGGQPNFIIKSNTSYLIPTQDEKPTLLGIRSGTRELFYDNLTFITSQSVDIDPTISDELNAVKFRDIFANQLINPILPYLSPELIDELNTAIATEGVPEEYILDLVTRIKDEIKSNSTGQLDHIPEELGIGWEEIDHNPDEQFEQFEPENEENFSIEDDEEND